jgi:capsule polysaccharide export protein KpsE/RkpR
MSTQNGSQTIASGELERDRIASRPVEDLNTVISDGSQTPGTVPNWVGNTSLLWHKRRALARVAGTSLALALLLVFLLPKQYESSARIMPPANSMGGAAVLAALTGHSAGALGSLGMLAGGLLGGGGNTALFIDLLRCKSVSDHLIDRFALQHVYRKRYRIDTEKFLARRTAIVDDKKSGVITLTVTDTDPVRARDLAQGYLDELNQLVNRTNTSSAHQERLFIEKRLHEAQGDLEKAQQRMSEFSSTHATIDIKEQARSMVDAASRLEAELIVEQAALDSLRQMYGDENVRVRSAQARIADLKTEIARMGGSSKPLPAEDSNASTPGTATNPSDDLYPPLRQLPRLAVPYADLYREVQIQESVYELLTQQFEVARIQEAKDVPVVSVIDSPAVPEKKSFPPRLLLALLLTVASVAVASAFFLIQRQWLRVPANDSRKVLANEIGHSFHAWVRTLPFLGRSVR